jgi:hypothetical protein
VYFPEHSEPGCRLEQLADAGRVVAAHLGRPALIFRRMHGGRFPRPALPFFDLSWPLSVPFACLDVIFVEFRLETRREPPSAPKEPVP